MGINSIKKLMNQTRYGVKGYDRLKCSLNLIAVLQFLILLWWVIAFIGMPNGNGNWIVPLMALFYLVMGIAISFVAINEDFNKLCGRPWNQVLKSKFYSGETVCTNCNKTTLVNQPEQPKMMVSVDMLDKPIMVPGYSEPMVLSLVNGRYKMPV